MATRKTDPEMGHGHAPARIIIERRETVAIVDSDPYGADPIVVVAFAKMGEVLNEQAARGSEPMGRLEFEYLGVRFEGTFDASGIRTANSDG